MNTLILRWFSQFSIESQRSRVDKNISFKLQCYLMLTNPISIRRRVDWKSREGEGRKIKILKTRTCSEQSTGVWMLSQKHAWRQQSTEQSDRTGAGDNAGDCGEAKGFSVASRICIATQHRASPPQAAYTLLRVAEVRPQTTVFSRRQYSCPGVLLRQTCWLACHLIKFPP